MVFVQYDDKKTVQEQMERQKRPPRGSVGNATNHLLSAKSFYQKKKTTHTE